MNYAKKVTVWLARPIFWGTALSVLVGCGGGGNPGQPPPGTLPPGVHWVETTGLTVEYDISMFSPAQQATLSGTWYAEVIYDGDRETYDLTHDDGDPQDPHDDILVCEPVWLPSNANGTTSVSVNFIPTTPGPNLSTTECQVWDAVAEDGHVRLNGRSSGGGGVAQ